MSFGALSFTIMAGPVAQFAGGPHVPTEMWPAGLAIGAVSGLLPDIDEPNAMLGRGGWMPRALGPLLKAFAVVVSLPFRVLGMIIQGTLGHRGGTHSLAMSVIFTLALAIPITAFFGKSADWAVWAIWAGYLSHLIADSLNPSGVPWLWPLFSKKKRFHLLPGPLRIPTETPPHPTEMMINLVVTAATALLCVMYFGVALLGSL